MRIRKYIKIFLVMCCIFSCDAAGTVFITNGYSHTVKLNVLYDYKGEVISDLFSLDEGHTMCVNARGFVQYDHIVQIQVLNLNNVIIAEYSPEYIIKIRNAYKDERNEPWELTPKGLFHGSLEINKRFRSASKMIEYYRSDEAVKDLEKRLSNVE